MPTTSPDVDPAADHGPRLAVLGAGPVGLDAALAARERGLPFTVYEAGSRPAAHVRRWAHVRLFSPWSMDVSPRMRRALEGEGHEVPDGPTCPTARAWVERVLDPVAALPGVAGRLRLGTRVVAVARRGMLKDDAVGDPARGEPPFRLLLREADGSERVEEADVVLDCTGTYSSPNRTGDGGIPAPGERALEDRIERHLPDVRGGAWPGSGEHVLLVGGGHSAQTAARDLAERAGGDGGPTVTWALRDPDPDLRPPEGDPLEERARLMERAAEIVADPPAGVGLRTGVVVDRLEREGERVAVELRRVDAAPETASAGPGAASRGAREGTAAGDAAPGAASRGGAPPRTGAGGRVFVDRILSLTGYVGDHTLYRQLQVHECWATCGPMSLAAELLGQDSADCLDQESHGVDVLRSPEPDFFVLGVKSYGRNSTFLLPVGWEQVSEVFGALEGDAATTRGGAGEGAAA